MEKTTYITSPSTEKIPSQVIQEKWVKDIITTAMEKKFSGRIEANMLEGSVTNLNLHESIRCPGLPKARGIVESVL